MAGSSQRDLRELRLQCTRLSSTNEELKLAADVGRMEARALRKRADAAEKELEAERKTGAELRRVRDALQAAASVDGKSIAMLKGQLCRGAPSSRLLDRARCLKRTVEDLKNQSNAQTLALSAKTAELEVSRREARALAAALGAITGKESPGGDVQGSATIDELLEMGKAKVMNHDLALGMARLSEASETLASEKQEVEKRLSEKTAEVETCRVETRELRDKLEWERKEAEGHREATSKANASTREAREILEKLRVKEKELLEDLKVAAR